MTPQFRCLDCTPSTLRTELNDGRVQHTCLVCGNEWFTSGPFETALRSPATNDTDEENTTVPATPETNPESDQEVQEGVGSLAQCSGLVAGE